MRIYCGKWLGNIIYLTVGNIEGSIMWALFGVWFGWSLRKPVAYFMGKTLVSSKGYTEHIIPGLELGN